VIYKTTFSGTTNNITRKTAHVKVQTQTHISNKDIFPNWSIIFRHWKI